ncbi:MAG TPA: hypothetical protein VGV64_07740 [Thermoplasmata archaeon]|nr:hypothetical protein [Thermoplasmata archaeon]HEV2429714.1 hypothetical protein [Thermoplasmata archaeon]
MEYVALQTVHPTWLTLQLPTEVAELIQYQDHLGGSSRTPGRGLAYLARGPGIVRIVSAYAAREVLPIEIVQNRYLATAHTTNRLLHNLPQAVIQHLGVEIVARGEKRTRSTDDELLYFLPAPEYYEFRAVERLERRWEGPESGGLAHVYLAKGVLPLPGEFPALAELEGRIETEEWYPRIEAIARTSRGRAA